MQTFAPASAAATAEVNPAPPEPMTTMSNVWSHLAGTAATSIADAGKEIVAANPAVDAAAALAKNDLRVMVLLMAETPFGVRYLLIVRTVSNLRLVYNSLYAKQPYKQNPPCLMRINLRKNKRQNEVGADRLPSTKTGWTVGRWHWPQRGRS
ncbi:hypothetical protein [Sutterella massiliensis]|uniref:hypothetical protein n=1 Tax=Sutterella massiliensis TaxID=1816689 RepID=UPI001EF6EFB2|nr:hypothetical protein [Sutterella massiliensis]